MLHNLNFQKTHTILKNVLPFNTTLGALHLYIQFCFMIQNNYVAHMILIFEISGLDK